MYEKFHVFTVDYVGPKHLTPVFFALKDNISREYKMIKINLSRFSSPLDQAVHHLEILGYNIIGTGKGMNSDYIISDTFKPLSDLPF